MEGAFWRDSAVPLSEDASAVEGHVGARKFRAAGASAMAVLGLFGVALIASGPDSRGLPAVRGAAELAATTSRPPRSFKMLTVEQATTFMEQGLVDQYHPYKLPVDFAERFADATNSVILAMRAALLADGYSEAEIPVEGLVRRPQMTDVEVSRWGKAHHPHVLRLSITGGVCGGKTSCKRVVEKEVEKRSHDVLVVITVPEIASLLFRLGAMNYGNFTTENANEYLVYVTHSITLQLALEELYTEAAENMIKNNPKAKWIVLLTDRDAIDAKAYTAPLLGHKEVAWSAAVEGAGKLLGQPNLTEGDLVRRYQLGAVVLQTYAIVAGKLNVDGYNRQCLGPQGSNAVRHESVEGARENDERINEAYRSAYPEGKICRVVNKMTKNFNEKVHDVVECVWRQIYQQIGQDIGP